MKYTPIAQDLFVRNRAKLVKTLKTNSLALINSNDVMPRAGDQDYFPYRQNSDLFYLTGINQEKSILALCPDHPDERYREVLFLVRADKEMETWYGHKFTEDEAREISGVKTIKWLDKFEGILADQMANSEYIYLNTNENPRYSTEVRYLDLRFIDAMKQKYPLHQYMRLAPILKELRVEKEPEEIELMYRACIITTNAFLRTLKFVKPGVREYEVEAEITHEFLRSGAAGHSYSPIIASGKNACILHYPDNDKECKDGDLLLMDFGAEYANYAADTTRTIPVNGKFTPRQRQVYEAVLRVLRGAIPLMVPGKTIFRLNKEVDKLMEKELLDLGLLKPEDVEKESADTDRERKVFFKYYMHGVSHFMGLEVHDIGTKDTVLRPGMVLSCEPGIYIPDESIGIRLENDILITDEEPIDLLKDEPIEPDDIERLMAE